VVGESEFFEAYPHDFGLLCIEKEGTKFGLAMEAATSLRIVQVMWIAPLMRIGWPSHGMLPRKK
jgi:hypothetical protein